jgi:hypothetical protein
MKIAGMTSFVGELAYNSIKFLETETFIGCSLAVD